MKAIEILEKELVGKFYSRFSVGDTFDFFFDSFWLVSQNIEAKEETSLNELLNSNYHAMQNAVDKEYVAKSIIISSTQRQLITEIGLDSNSALTLVFENNVQITLVTDTEIVDWHWALNRNGGDPYRGFMVGCFNQGEVEVGSS